MTVEKKTRIPGVRYLFSYTLDVNGKEQVFYGYDKYLGGKRRQKVGFTNKRDAERELMLLIARYTDDPRLVHNPKIRLSELARHWVESLKRQQSSKTHCLIAELVSGKFIKPVGDITLENVDSESLTKYRLSLEERGLKHSTILLHMRILKAYLNSAKRLFPNLHWTPPVMERWKARTERIEPEVTIEMINKIIKTLREMDDPRSFDVADMVLIGSRTAMRLGDIISLKWMSVRFTAAKKAPNGTLAFIHQKTGLIDHKPMTEDVRNVLLARSEKTGNGEKVFDWGIQHNSMRTAVEDLFKAACQKVGILYGRDIPGGMRFHSLRHFVVRFLKDEGVDLSSIAAYGGWTQQSMLMLYGKANPTSLHKTMTVMENISKNDKAQDPSNGEGSGGKVKDSVARLGPEEDV